MPDRVGIVDIDPAAFSSSLVRLESRVAALEEALAALTAERHAADPSAHTTPLTPAFAAREPAGDVVWTVATAVTLAGRTLIALGGGYLLRALTESAVVPPTAGVVAGLAYAVMWAALCIRAAKAGGRISAIFHGLTAALVGFPLLWEATTRFALFTPSGGALVLALFTLLILLAARRANVEAIGWFGALGAIATAFALAVNTSGFVPYTVALAAVGIATLWLGYLDEWVLLRWPVAAAVDLMVLVITLRAVDPDVGSAPTPVLAVQLLILALYLGSFVGRSLLLRREVIIFEVVQSAAAMALCFGGALWVLNTIRVSAVPLGLAALALGPATYAFAFSFVERRKQVRNVAFFTSLALAFTLAGLVIVLPAPLAAPSMAVIAAVIAEWGRRSDRLTLAIHALVFAAAMATLAGLTMLTATALFANTIAVWPRFTPAHVAALIVVCAICLWPVPSRAGATARRALQLADLSLLMWMAAGSVVAALVPVLSSAAGTDAGLVATTRTVVLVAGAAALVQGRRPLPIERIWLSYGLLALIAFKLVAEDLLRGRPATLFVALAAYGAALIAIPRLVRKNET